MTAPLNRLRALVAMLPLGTSAAYATSGGAEGALIFTSTLTLVIIATLFFILVLPEEERRKRGEVASRLRTLDGHAHDP